MADLVVEREIPAPGTALCGIAWDGEQLWHADAATSLLYAIDSETGVVRRTLSCPDIRTCTDFAHGLLWQVVGRPKVRVGEDWTSGAWLRGRRREPEFIPLSLIQDGKAIRELKSIDAALGLRVFIGAARISSGSSDLIDIPPIPADGIKETQKVRRINAGMILTLRAVGLRLWIVLSGLNERWQIRWPKGVTTLSSQSRYDRLATVNRDELGTPSLIYRGPGSAPDVETMFTAALDLAMTYFEAPIPSYACALETWSTPLGCPSRRPPAP